MPQFWVGPTQNLCTCGRAMPQIWVFRSELPIRAEVLQELTVSHWPDSRLSRRSTGRIPMCGRATRRGSYDDAIATNKLKVGIQGESTPNAMQICEIGSKLMIDSNANARLCPSSTVLILEPRATSKAGKRVALGALRLSLSGFLRSLQSLWSPWSLRSLWFPLRCRCFYMLLPGYIASSTMRLILPVAASFPA